MDLPKAFARVLVDDDHHDDDDDDHDAPVDPHAGHNHGSHDDDDHEEGLSVNAFKIIMLFMMILCVGFGVIPKVWPACQKSENALSFLNCFSAGIFLGMSLVHMMPEATEIYAIWAAKEGIEKPFPLPYVGFFMGYMLILGVDRVAAKACGVGHSHGGEEKKPVANVELQQIEGTKIAPASEDMGFAGTTDRGLNGSMSKKSDD